MRLSSRPPSIALISVLALAAVLGAVGCSDTGDKASSTSPTTAIAPTTTVDGDADASSTTVSSSPATTTTVAGPSTTTSTERPPTTQTVPTPSAELTTGVYWTRPVGGDPVSIGSYTDPSSGTLPFVVYGSVTNTGSSTITNPSVTGVWRNGAGDVVAVFPGRIVDPRGNTVTSIAPQQTIDAVVVVDPADADGLDGLTAELIGTAR